MSPCLRANAPAPHQIPERVLRQAVACGSVVLAVACGGGGGSGSSVGTGSEEGPPVLSNGSSSATDSPPSGFDAELASADGQGMNTEAQPLPQLPSDVNVIITADNAYGFGYGAASELVNYFGGVENITSDDIFQCPVGNGPEQYLVPAADGNAGSFLYIVSYADKQTTQGVIGKFFREGAPAIFTGNGAWQVCATGEDFDPGLGGPSRAQINEQLAICNAGGGDPALTSQGWVGTSPKPQGNVVFGEDNSTERDRPAPGNEFRIACGIDAEARWMWYDWRQDQSLSSPFIWPGGNQNATRDFLIFRLGAEVIPLNIR
jgi:hypothetical protein